MNFDTVRQKTIYICAQCSTKYTHLVSFCEKCILNAITINLLEIREDRYCLTINKEMKIIIPGYFDYYSILKTIGNMLGRKKGVIAFY